AAARVGARTPAPAAAGHELAIALEHEVRTVGEEHRIRLGHVADRALGLTLVVEAREDRGRRLLYQRLDTFGILGRCDAELGLGTIHPSLLSILLIGAYEYS